VDDVTQHDKPVTAEQGAVTGDKPEGAISAAVLAAGVGATVLGLVTALAETSAIVKNGLQWSAAVGPLSGKTIVAVLAWLLSWAVLHAVLRNRPTETGRALTIALVLIGLGVLGTFPPFYQLFAAE
jgi:hypothetical protein